MSDTNDFLERLRQSGGIGLDGSSGCCMCEQAAKEIKRLKTEVMDLRKAIKLMIGRQRNLVWSSVSESDVDSWLIAVRT